MIPNSFRPTHRQTLMIAVASSAFILTAAVMGWSNAVVQRQEAMRQLGQAETLTARFDVIVASHPSSMITAENVRPSAVEIDRIARTLGLEVSVAAPARQAAEDPRWDVERTIVTLDGPSLAAVGRLVHALRDLDQPLHCESVEVSALQPSPASGTVPWHYRLTLTRLVPAA